MRCAERLGAGWRSLALVCLLAPRPAHGAGLREAGDAWLLAPADTAALLAGRAGAGAPGDAGPWFTAGQARLWGMPDLPLLELAGGVATGGGRWSVGGVWHRTGADLLRVERQGVWAAWHGRWELRVEAGREHVLVAGEEAAGHTDVALVAGPDVHLGEASVLRLRAWTSLAPTSAGDRRLQPAVRAVLRRDGVAVAAAWDRRVGGPPALGFEVAAALNGAATLGLRWDGASASLGPQLALRLGPLLLRTSHLVHPVLGVTHRFAITGGVLGAARR